MKLLNKCPVCGDKLEVDILYQFSEIHSITRSGTYSKGFRKEKPMPMECRAIRCVNRDFETDYELNVINPKDYYTFGVVQIDDKHYLEEK